MDTWYLLYAGSSADGRGQPDYVGRTLCAREAMRHYNNCRKSPYLNGKVFIVTDTTVKDATEHDFK